MDRALCTLARLAGVAIEPRDVAVELRARPGYPGLVAITRTLEVLGIGAFAAEVSDEAIDEVVPAIAQTSDGLVVIESCTASRVVIASENGRRRSIDRRSFEARFTGVVVATTGELRPSHRRGALERSARARRRARAVVAVGLALWAAALAVLGLDRPATLALVALGGVGLIASASLVALDLGVDTALGRALCPIGARRDGCRAVAASRLARIAGVPLSTIGLCYFAAQHLALAWSLAAPADSSAGPALAQLMLASGGFAIAALAYQAAVVRAWCRLCVAVQIAALGQAALVFESALQIPIDHRGPIAALGALAATAALVSLAREPLEAAARHRATLSALMRLRRDPDRLDGALASAAPIELGALDGDVVIGDAGAPVELGLVASLECPGCLAAIGELGDLVDRLGGAVRVRARIAERPADPAVERTCAAIIGPALRGDHDRAWRALIDHAAGRAPTSQPRPSDLVLAPSVLATNARWCDRLELRALPARSINGRLLDPDIAFADLEPLLADARRDRSRVCATVLDSLRTRRQPPPGRSDQPVEITGGTPRATAASMT